MYFGAYPGGNVIEFDTITDTFTDLGQMVEGEQYAHAEATINGVTVRSNQLTFHVEPNAVYMQERLDAYLNSGDLKNPLYVQLTNSLKQATHHKNNGRQAQALKHLERFLQHLHNEVMEKFISQSAKDKLIRDANQLLQVWSSK